MFVGSMSVETTKCEEKFHLYWMLTDSSIPQTVEGSGCFHIFAPHQYRELHSEHAKPAERWPGFCHQRFMRHQCQRILESMGKESWHQYPVDRGDFYVQLVLFLLSALTNITHSIASAGTLNADLHACKRSLPTKPSSQLWNLAFFNEQRTWKTSYKTVDEYEGVGHSRNENICYTLSYIHILYIIKHIILWHI